MSVSEGFKKVTKGIKMQDIKLTINDKELMVKEIHFMPVNIFNKIPIGRLKSRREVIAKNIKYSFEGQLFKTIMQQIEITVKNAKEIKSKNVNFRYGLCVEDNFEYVDLGEFYINDVDDDKASEELTVTGYDKMLNFMKPFKISDLELEFPCSMLKLVKAMCVFCGVELYSTEFYNSDLEIGADYFTVQQLTHRDVLEKITQSTLTTAFINGNKLCLCKIEEPVETLDKSYLSKLTIGGKLGPINALVLGRGDVEDNVESVDEISINKYGRHEIRFDENEILDYRREQLISDMLKQINGLEYYEYEASDVGVMWLKPCDCVILKDREDNEYKSIYLKANVQISTGITKDFGVDIPETSTTEYKFTTEEEKKQLRVERLAKKNEGLIEDVIEEQTDMSNKLSKVEQNVDSINQTVKETLDFTVEMSGTNELLLVDSSDYNILLFQAEAKNVDSANYFSESLKFSEGLYPTFAGQTITLVVDKQSRVSPSNEKTEYNYEIDPLRSYYDACDKFIVEINDETKKCNVKILRYLKKINGNFVILTIPEEEILAAEIDIKMFRDTTHLYLKEYTNWNMKASYISNPNLNKYYASKVDLSTEINQTAEEIESIALKKVDREEFGTYITQNAESIRYAWNQISQYLQMEGIDGKATLNIYDKNEKMLMSLSQDGQKFFKSNGEEIGSIGLAQKDGEDILAFIMNVDWEKYSQGKSMAWGYKDKNGNFLPIFYLVGVSGDDNSEYSGQLAVEGSLVVGESIKIVKDGVNFNDNGKITGLAVADTNPETGEIVGVAKWLQLKSDYGIELLCNNEFILNATKNGIYTSKPFNSNQNWTDINGTSMPTTVFNTAIKSKVNTNGGNFMEGICVLGLGGHTYQQYWNGSALLFSVDGTYIGNLSDKRLKKDFKKIEGSFLEAIEELEIQQFKIKNRNEKISFGIIAQDLIEVFNKYGLNPNEYEILQEIQYDLSDETKYYKIEYLQYLILKQLAKDKKIKALEEKDKQKDETIANLIKRVEALEGGI